MYYLDTTKAKPLRPRPLYPPVVPLPASRGAVLHLWYPIKELQKQVTIKTANLGKNRGTQEEPHLLDRLTMTRDEEELFFPIAENAAAEVFDSMIKYTERLKQPAFEFNAPASGTPSTQDYSQSAHFAIDFPPYLSEQEIPTLDIAVKNALETYIIKEWLAYSYPGEVQVWEEKHSKAGELLEKRLNTFVPQVGRRTGRWI